MRYIDLTMPLTNGMRGVEIESSRVLERDGWNATTLHLYSHAGTHMDAPMHFDVNRNTIDEYPISRFFCDCWIVDIPNCQPAQVIGVKDVIPVEGKIRPGEGLIFRTGWSKFATQEIYRSQLPRIGLELALWCADHQIGLLGVEPPSVADVNNIEELTAVHKVLLEADILIVEGLCQLDQIKHKKVSIVALPLKVMNGDGSPCRVIALEERKNSN